MTVPAERVYNVDMKKYRYILFDLDGTLVYSHPGIFSCFRYAMEKMGRERPTDEALKPVVGPSLHYSFTSYFQMNGEEAERAVALYREEYARAGMWKNEPVEGALACLKALKGAGYSTALATSKPLEYASKIVAQHGFSPYLTVLAGSRLDGSFPTKADVVEEAVRLLGAEKEACLLVGDRRYDAEGAALAGVDCALLKIGGYASEEELYSCGARYVLADFAELTEFLLQ